MKKFLLWFLSFIITVCAAYYQRKTGPTYPRIVKLEVNGKINTLKLVRSLSTNERPEVRLAIMDTSVRAKLFYKRSKSADAYTESNFTYKIYPVHSPFLNKVFGITEEKGLFAPVPVQPVAGKLEYYFELTDSHGTRSVSKENPVVVRFKGDVPASVLIPHILIMFLAMFFSTLAGLMGLFRLPEFKKYSVWTLVLLITGGIILGSVVQKFAFGEFWTGVPFGWDLTDNKTLIAALFWILAVVMNRKRETPLYTILAAIVLLLVFSIPHSVLGSEFNYKSGQVSQGLIFIFSLKIFKKKLN